MTQTVTLQYSQIPEVYYKLLIFTIVINPIVSKIRDWLIQLQSRHKTIQLCWFPSHIDIAGNERADQQARAAFTNGVITPDAILHRDYYPIIKSAVSYKWNSKWQVEINNKLKLKRTLLYSGHHLLIKIENMKLIQPDSALDTPMQHTVIWWKMIAKSFVLTSYLWQ